MQTARSDMLYHSLILGRLVKLQRLQRVSKVPTSETMVGSEVSSPDNYMTR